MPSETEKISGKAAFFARNSWKGIFLTGRNVKISPKTVSAPFPYMPLRPIAYLRKLNF
jgi:hypothetical protein